jgi:hypothetical protein
MISFYLIFIFLFSLVRFILMDPSPFQLTLNYDSQQIINKNFTITTELHQDTSLLINCGDNRHRLCLVDLSLQIQSDTMFIEFSCQSPAFSLANFNQYQSVHTCILLAVNASQQPSITMIINAHNIGRLSPLAIANFTYSPQYRIEKQAEPSIVILVRNKNWILKFLFLFLVR